MYAKESVGIKDGSEAGKAAVKWFAKRIIELDGQPSDIESQLNQKCLQIPHEGNIFAISGIGDNTHSGILAEMGDDSRFDDVKKFRS